MAGRGRWWSRPAWALIASASMWILALAALLDPAPEGLGTHTQLGLAPCTFLVITGYPCPSCGLTTCFAHMVRLEVFEALSANGPGVLMFIIVVALLPISLFAMARDMPVVETVLRLRGDLVAVVIAATSLISWGIDVAMIALMSPR